MSTDKAVVAEIVEQLEPLDVRARAMFGEYGLYCDDKMVALICDDRLYLKPSPVAADFADESWLASPYPGAKPHYLVPTARLADSVWLGQFVKRTADVLPKPVRKPRKRPAKPQ
ncbi:TfoX/Sxy family protein [Nocardia sp. NPDC050710]|uniref:TfoX/Sxy family protein n=1 Tax=Nocardia sp. NPDC050710 TaxID=3157220 RepID=UPI0034015E66